MTDTQAVSPRPDPGAHGVRLDLALRRLGHRCAGACRSAAEELDAPLWFVRHDLEPGPRRGRALVVVDCSQDTGPLLHSITLLRLINLCTSGDRIRVQARRAGDTGNALSAVRPLVLTPG